MTPHYVDIARERLANAIARVTGGDQPKLPERTANEMVTPTPGARSRRPATPAVYIGPIFGTPATANAAALSGRFWAIWGYEHACGTRQERAAGKACQAAYGEEAASPFFRGAHRERVIWLPVARMRGYLIEFKRKKAVTLKGYIGVTFWETGGYVIDFKGIQDC